MGTAFARRCVILAVAIAIAGCNASAAATLRLQPISLGRPRARRRRRPRQSIRRRPSTRQPARRPSRPPLRNQVEHPWARPRSRPSVAITDGDTIRIDRGHGSEKVRYIGMNTPEVGDPAAARRPPRTRSSSKASRSCSSATCPRPTCSAGCFARLDPRRLDVALRQPRARDARLRADRDLPARSPIRRSLHSRRAGSSRRRRWPLWAAAPDPDPTDDLSGAVRAIRRTHPVPDHRGPRLRGSHRDGHRQGQGDRPRRLSTGRRP